MSAQKVSLIDLNPHITCFICKGYLIDAVTSTECLHAFCKSCILKYVELNRNCPICDTQIHKTRPTANLREDKALQDMVYKLVPELHADEMRRRKKFYSANADQQPECSVLVKQEKEKKFFSEFDLMSISLEYFDNDTNNKAANKTKSNMENNSNKRYLQCPGLVTIRTLKKFIRTKYGLDDSFVVDVIYKRELVSDHSTLIDIAYNANWRKSKPMQFCYRIFKKNRIVLRKRKVAASESTAIPEAKKFCPTNIGSNTKETSSKAGNKVGVKMVNESDNNNGNKMTSVAAPTSTTSMPSSAEVVSTRTMSPSFSKAVSSSSSSTVTSSKTTSTKSPIPSSSMAALKTPKPPHTIPVRNELKKVTSNVEKPLAPKVTSSASLGIKPVQVSTASSLASTSMTSSLKPSSSSPFTMSSSLKPPLPSVTTTGSTTSNTKSWKPNPTSGLSTLTPVSSSSTNNANLNSKILSIGSATLPLPPSSSGNSEYLSRIVQSLNERNMRKEQDLLRNQTVAKTSNKIGTKNLTQSTTTTTTTVTTMTTSTSMQAPKATTTPAMTTTSSSVVGGFGSGQRQLLPKTISPSIPQSTTITVKTTTPLDPSKKCNVASVMKPTSNLTSKQFIKLSAQNGEKGTASSSGNKGATGGKLTINPVEVLNSGNSKKSSENRTTPTTKSEKKKQMLPSPTVVPSTTVSMSSSSSSSPSPSLLASQQQSVESLLESFCKANGPLASSMAAANFVAAANNKQNLELNSLNTTSSLVGSSLAQTLASAQMVLAQQAKEKCRLWNLPNVSKSVYPGMMTTPPILSNKSLMNQSLRQIPNPSLLTNKNANSSGNNLGNNTWNKTATKNGSASNSSSSNSNNNNNSKSVNVANVVSNSKGSSASISESSSKI